MTLNELETAAAVHSFKSDNKNTLICFSATWCGPCKASKPTLVEMARSYEADPTVDLKCAIVYEHTLKESIHEFQVSAFPTYVLYTNNGSNECGRVKGANFEGIRELVSKAGCKMNLGEGNTLGGTASVAVSAEEARAHRLAMFEKKKTAASAPASDSNEKTVAEAPNADADMQEKEAAAETAGKTDENADADMKDADPENTDGTKEDTEMKDATTDEPEMVDPTEKLSKEDIETLESMGFTTLRAQKGLLNGGENVQGAIDWIGDHQEDADIDDPIPKVPKAGGVAQSYKCNDCGRILSNMANLELHANKTGHSDFEESTQCVKALTPEEKEKKIAEVKALLKAKRAEREALEKVEDVDREKQRRSMGKEIKKTREEMEQQARKHEARLRRKEKEDFKRERARIRAEIEKDKLERKAHHGKKTSKLGVDGYNPDAIQYNVNAEGGTAEHPHKKMKANVAKIDEYIKKVSSYKAGGDGGKCLKILLAYVKNVVEKPEEDKFKRINMENKIYKTKVKPFVGAKALLLAIGFVPNASNDAMILSPDAKAETLAETKEKLAAAYEAY